MAGSQEGNADVDWSRFDSEAYFQHYYADPHPDDDEVVRRAGAALWSALPEDRSAHVVDVGTGANLFPLLCALPRADRLTAWEYAAGNVAWLRAELAGGAVRPQWRHFWNVLRAGLSDAELPEDPMPRLRNAASVEQGSVFDLPSARWDGATMFFCAESITARREEFAEACRRFAGCVRPGGPLVAAFLVRSRSYDFSDHAFPVVEIDENDIGILFRDMADEVKTSPIGLSDTEARSGYTGMVLLEARAR